MGDFGPWAPGILPAERLARLRAMRALAMTVARPHAGELIRGLRRAPRTSRPHCPRRWRCSIACRRSHDAECWPAMPPWRGRGEGV